MRMLEDVTSGVNGSQWFSTLDAKHVYHQTKLDFHSTSLFTFNTNFGWKKYFRAPMKINTASDKFQRRMKDEFEGMKGVEIIMAISLYMRRQRNNMMID